MILTTCKKATIYDVDYNEISVATVTDVSEDGVELVIADDDIDNLDSEMNVTFFDEQKGLVTYRCSLYSKKKYLNEHNILVHNMTCTPLQEISTVQRRNDFKIPVSIPIEYALIPTQEELDSDVVQHDKYRSATTVNLSAGGIFFYCDDELFEGRELNILLPIAHSSRIKLSATILRKIEVEENSAIANFGYGCSFNEMHSSTETKLRSFVYQQQMILHKRKRLK